MERSISRRRATRDARLRLTVTGATMAGVATECWTESSGVPQVDHVPQRHTRWLPLVLWLGALVVGTGVFHGLGGGPLAAPPRDPTVWSAWLAERDPLVASIAVLRLLVLALSWYLVGATTIGIVARLARAVRLVRIADALTVPFVRRLLRTTLGVSLATAMVTSAMPTGPVATSFDAASMKSSAMPIDRDGAELLGGMVPTGVAEVELRVVSGEQPTEVARERVAPSSRPLPLELLDRARGEGYVPGADGGADGETNAERAGAHTVVAGDSLWSIAEAAMPDRDGQRPDDRVVADYWRTVVDANRDRLTDPENPDLIFPGQVVRLPELPR